MGRIKNKDKYNQDTNVTFFDYLIGSDGDDNGKTKNYSIQSIFDLIASELDVAVQNNKLRVINIGYVYNTTVFDETPTLEDISSVINSLQDNSDDYKTVNKDELVLFVGYLYSGKGKLTLNKYGVKGFGRGIYGVGGDIVLSGDNLELIESSSVGGQSLPPLSDDPNAEVTDLGEIGVSDFLDVINSLPQFTITAGTNYYFEYTVSGSRFVYGFRGVNGTYGTGGTPMTSNDVFLIYDETSTPIEYHEGYTEKGLRADGSLKVAVGDYDSSFNGTLINISDSDEEIRLEAEKVKLGDTSFLNASTVIELDNSTETVTVSSENGVNFKVVGNVKSTNSVTLSEGSGVEGNLNAFSNTAPRNYNFPDKSGTVALVDDTTGFIPLSGTTPTNYITGDLEIDDAIQIKPLIGGGGYYLGDSLIGAIQIGVDGSLIVQNDFIANPLFRGLKGKSDYSPNIQPLDFTQKVYVDSVSLQDSVQTSGTRAGGDLIISIGDFDVSGSETEIELDDNNTTVTITAYEGLRLTPSTTPTTPVAGTIYYDSSTNKLRCYDGTIWNDMF